MDARNYCYTFDMTIGGFEKVDVCEVFMVI